MTKTIKYRSVKICRKKKDDKDIIIISLKTYTRPSSVTKAMKKFFKRDK